MDNEKSIIEKAKNSFTRAFFVSEYTNILKDDEHLNNILKEMKVMPGGKILDLGTGTGYLAFPLAKMFPNCKVIGLDLADTIMMNNNERASKEGLTNLHFLSYDGESFPLDCNYLNNVVTRYAIHHFPNLNKTFKTLGEVVAPGGQFFISDPVPNEDDENKIIDKYMSVKDDGHVKFYTKDEFESLLKNYGFETDVYFYSNMDVAFPEREDYVRITSMIDKKMHDSYNIKIIDNRVHMRLRILNISFFKSKLSNFTV